MKEGEGRRREGGKEKGEREGEGSEGGRRKERGREKGDSEGEGREGVKEGEMVKEGCKQRIINLTM